MDDFNSGALARRSASPILHKQVLLPWLVCFSAALFFFYEFIQINMFNAISAGLIESFSLNATQLGNLAATYLYSTVLFLFPIGVLLDRFSTRKLILIAMSVCVSCTFLFSFSTSLFMAQMCRFVAGAGGAFCFLSSLMLASRWFPQRRMATVTGLIVTLAMIGGMVAQTPLTLLTEVLGWRHALMLDAGIGLIFLVIIWKNVQDYPAATVSIEKSTSHQFYASGFWKSIRLALFNSQNWLAGFYTSFLNLLILLLGAVWGNSYLQQVHHLTNVQASYVTSMIFVGTIIGSPILGWISDKIALRRLPMIVSAIVSLILILAVIYFPQASLSNLMLLFLALGFFTSAQIISYPVIMESNSKAITGASEGIASAIIMAGGAVFQPVFGWLMDLHWQGQVVHNVRVYSSQDFSVAIWILPVAFCVSIILAFFIRETHCKNK